MKNFKYLLTGFLVFISVFVFGQIADSLLIQQAQQIGFNLATGINNNENLIPQVPNSVLSALITAVTALVIRFFGKRKLKAKHDKEIEIITNLSKK